MVIGVVVNGEPHVVVKGMLIPLWKYAGRVA